MTENTSVLIFSCRHMEINVQFQWTKGGWAWSFVAWTGTIWIVSILYSLDRNQGWCFIGVTIGSRLQVTWETLARYSRTVLVTLHPDRNTIEILNLAIWFVLELGHVSLVSTLYPVSCTHVQLQRAVLTTKTQTFNKIWLIFYLFPDFQSSELEEWPQNVPHTAENQRQAQSAIAIALFWIFGEKHQLSSIHEVLSAV